MKRKKTKKQKGFLLVEAIVYIFVMSLLLVVILGSAGGYLKNRFSLKKDQQAIEEMSLAINEVAKRIRMSNCGKNGDKCTFDNNKLVVVENAGGDNLTLEFKEGSLKNGTDIILKDIDTESKFYYKNGDDDSDGVVDGIPLITIQIQKAGKPQTKMQTSVSQRGGYIEL